MKIYIKCHGYQQQMVSFEVLFTNALKPGGIYFIEDIETSYWTNYEQYGNIVQGGKNHPNAPLSMFLEMVHVMNREFHNHSDYIFFPIDRLIESLSFSHNIIEIAKVTRFPDAVYDNRQYRFKYTMDRYGASIPNIPHEYEIYDEIKDVMSEDIALNLIDKTLKSSSSYHTTTFTTSSTTLKWDRFTFGKHSLNNAAARLCLEHAIDPLERRNCTNRVVNYVLKKKRGRGQRRI